MHENVFIAGAGHKGLGVFAARNFTRGEVIMRFRGPVVQHETSRR